MAQKTIPIPMIVGYEFYGTIEEIGKEVNGFNIGDRDSREGYLTCGNCRAGQLHLCRNTKRIGVNIQGCFAQYLVMPAFNVFKLPESISDAQAAIFDLFGNAVHTALSFDMVGEDVLITGAEPIGSMAVAGASHVGARHIVITDINDYRLDLVKKWVQQNQLM